jgi:hypothetical protein
MLEDNIDDYWCRQSVHLLIASSSRLKSLAARPMPFGTDTWLQTFQGADVAELSPRQTEEVVQRAGAVAPMVVADV